MRIAAKAMVTEGFIALKCYKLKTLYIEKKVSNQQPKLPSQENRKKESSQ